MRRLIRILVWPLVLLALFLVATFFTLRMETFGRRPEGARLERIRHSPQFHDTRFQNSPPQKDEFDWATTIHIYRGKQMREPQFAVPVVKLTAADFPTNIPPGLRARWLGHSTTLIEIDGLRILTDPIFSDRASPFQWIGPKRLHALPLALDQVRHVDAVLISHDHFDHLDMASIKYLATRGTHFYVPLGIGSHLERWHVPAAQVHEMDWWDSADIDGVRINCTPARHYSGRTSANNSTLWSAWLVRGPQHSFYYSGDTGYSPHFTETHNRLGAVDLALIKVGAYGDTWLDIHMDPESAIQAHKDLGAKVLLPVHWATFNLSYHAWNEPILRTLAAAQRASVEVITPAPGEQFDFDKPFTNREWYLHR
jgi:L-ascorbate metabolism protein UlaG (beta-lactamase superfamily)